MTITKQQTDQMVNEDGLKSIGSSARETLKSIAERIGNELESPLRIHATFPVADAKLNFSQSITSLGDGAKKSMPPIKSQIYNLPQSSINFQDQTTVGATFVIVWPTVNAIGTYRRVGFTLLGNGSIQALFSPEAATIGALVNAGTLFVKSGTALGFIDLECTDNTSIIKFKTAGSATDIIENAQVYRFGAGSGSGGSGSGDANSFETNMAIRLDESYFQFATPVVFEVTESTLVETGTATYNLVDATYDFDGVQDLQSVDLLNDSFKALENDARQIELHAEWFNSASLDESATYDVSLNGGVDFTTISMGRVFSTNKFIGKGILNEPSNTSLDSQTTEDISKKLNSTTIKKIAQKFTLTSKSAVKRIGVGIVKTGTPNGSYIISLAKDNAGGPGDVIQSRIMLCESLIAGPSYIYMEDFKNILVAGDYWIIIETDDTYKASFNDTTTHIAIKTDSASSGYVYGSSWSTLVGYALYYEVFGYVYSLKVRITSSGAGKKLKAFGIFFDEQIGSTDEGLSQYQDFVFSGDENKTEFNITRFLPDSRRMKVYDIYSGQVYKYPSFNIDGRKVTFTNGTFLVSGSIIRLSFDQSEGSGYDNSDYNASLLTANHFGSSDSTIDRSANGRGPLLRDELGNLKEIWIDSSGNLNITNPKG